MRQTLQTIYRTTAAEFARRVTSALGDHVEALVLFGSVVRGEAIRSSDINIVVIGPQSCRDARDHQLDPQGLNV